jgi:hypothetical protein
MNSKWKDRLFEIFLLLLGVVIGVVPILYLQTEHESRLKESVAVFLRTNAFLEVSHAKQLKAEIENAIEDRRASKISLKSSLWFHDPALVLSVSSNIGFMEPEIVGAFETYYSSLKQCRQFQETIIKIDVIKSDEKSLRAYTDGLGMLIENGSQIISLIDKYYPNAKLSQ